MLKLKEVFSKDRSIAAFERPPPEKKRFSLLFFKSCSVIDKDFRQCSAADFLESSTGSSSSLPHKRSKSYSTPPSQFEESAASTLLSNNKEGDDERSSELGHADTIVATTATAAAESDRFLQLGMQCHERGELDKATYYWRLSADNESPLGLFFYGIALRHGWGCKKNAAIAVRHFQKAAECAVYDLQTGIAKSTTVAKSELVLAIYELGVCFRHGWGVPKNLATASYYFEIAANLGDPDAQNDLAFCYAHGHGVKKDIYKAAMYYRMADRQGHGIVGNSWIWKDKYSIVDDVNWEGRPEKHLEKY